MKTIEELKGMTQEDLVRLVQELYEKCRSEEDKKRMYMNKSESLTDQVKLLKDVVKTMSNLI